MKWGIATVVVLVAVALPAFVAFGQDFVQFPEVPEALPTMTISKAAEPAARPTHHHRPTPTPTHRPSPTPTPTHRPSPTPTAKGTPMPKGSPASVSSTVGLANVARIGLNLDQQQDYDQRALMQNYIDSPGQEFGSEGHLVKVASPNSTTFTDSQDYFAPEQTGFWNGQTATIRTGSCAGQIITIGIYTAGGTYTYSPACAGLTTNDLIGEFRSDAAIGNHSDAIGTWNPFSDGLTIFNLSSAQHHTGASSLSVDVSGGSGEALGYFLDAGTTVVGTCIAPNQGQLCQSSATCPGATTCQTAPQIPFHPIKGPMTFSAWFLVSGSTGTPTVSFSITRTNSSWGSTSHSFTLTSDGAWHHYTYSWTGLDTATDVGEVQVNLNFSNGTAQAGEKIYMDDVFMGPTTTTAPGGFRSEVLTSMAPLKLGVLRYMVPVMLAADEAHFDAADNLRGITTDSYGTTAGHYPGWVLGVSDMYPLAAAAGAVPWVSISDIWSDADLTAFANKLCTAMTTYSFPYAVIEGSNEDWAAQSVRTGTTNEGALWRRNFGILAAAPNCAGKTLKLVMSGQAANSGVLSGATQSPLPNNANYAGDIATYLAGADQNTGLTLNQMATMNYANGNAYFTSGTDTFSNAVPNNLGALCGGGGGCNQVLDTYESGIGNTCGTATPLEAYEADGWMIAGPLISTWLQSMAAGQPIQNVYNLAQGEFNIQSYNCGSGNTTTFPGWGIFHDLDSFFGPTFPHTRPAGQALELLNMAVQGDFHRCTGAPAGVVCGGFLAGGKWTLAATNSNSTPTAFSVTFPTGTVPSVAQTINFTTNIADNNENSNSTSIGPLAGGTIVSGQTVTVTIPAFAPVVLTQAPPGIPALSLAQKNAGVWCIGNACRYQKYPLGRE